MFLAGVAIALSVERRLARGEDPRAVDRHLLVRGGLLVLLKAWMGLGFIELPFKLPGAAAFQASSWSCTRCCAGCP